MGISRFVKSNEIVASAFFRLLAVMALANLMYALSTLADDIIMTRFLGEYGIAAFGLSIPFQYLMAMLGAFFGSGTQVVCSGQVGSGEKAKANRTFTQSTIVMLALTIIIAIVCIVGAEPIALALGAREDPKHLLVFTRDYLIGMSLGLPFYVATSFLLPIAALNGKNKHVAAATNAMMITTVAGDLANVLIFNGGMFGMGLAVSLSFVFSTAILVMSFLKGEGIRFDPAGFSLAGFQDVARSGALASLTRLSTIARSFALNIIFLTFAGTTALAANSLVQSGPNQFFTVISMAVGNVTLVMVSYLFSEADLDGLQDLFHSVVKVMLGPCLLITVLVFILADPIMSIFTSDTQLIELGSRALRIYIVSLPLFTARQFYLSYFQASHSAKMAAFTSITGEFVFLVAASYIGVRLFGVDGLWAAYPVAELLYLLAILAFACVKYGHLPHNVEEFLFLDEGFDVPDERDLEITVHNLDEIGTVHEQVLAFCDGQGFSERTGVMLAFASEELMNDIYCYGIGADEEHSLTYHMKVKDDRIIMYTRDDFPAFDVTARHEMPAGDLITGVGVRMLFALSSDVKYNSAFSLNNVMVEIPREALLRSSEA